MPPNIKDIPEKNFWAYDDDPNFLCDGPDCSVQNPAYKCERCRCAFYCSLECQKAAYLDHKSSCADFTVLAKQAKEQVWFRDSIINPLLDFTNFQFTNEFCACGMQFAEDSCPIPNYQCEHALCPQCYHQNQNTACPLCPEKEEESSDTIYYRPDLGSVLVGRVDQLMRRAEGLPRQEQAACYERALEEATQLGNIQSRLRGGRPSESDHAKGCIEDYYILLRLLECKIHRLLGHPEYALDRVSDILSSMIPDCWVLLDYTRENHLSLVSACREASEVGGMSGYSNHLSEDIPLGRILLTTLLEKARALEDMQEWEKACSIYKELVVVLYLPLRTLCDCDKLSFLRSRSGHDSVYESNKHKLLYSVGVSYGAAIYMGFSRCAIATGRSSDYKGDLERVAQLATRQSPGFGRAQASYAKSLGDTELALTLMKRAFIHEEPWNFENTRQNHDFYDELLVDMIKAEEQSKKEEEFNTVWGEVVQAIDEIDRNNPITTWYQIKHQKFDMMDHCNALETDAPDLRKATEQVLADAQTRALDVTEESSTLENISTRNSSDDVITDRLEQSQLVNYGEVEDAAALSRIFMTKDVIKWRDRADNLYLEMFVKKVTNLANGVRSMTAAKGLKGSQNRIFETYLENSRGGHRILWTEDQKHGLIIWYVCHHDKVSRMMELIDQAERRSNRQMTEASALPEFEHAVAHDRDTTQDLDANAILLDPSNDTPLKLYEIKDDEISQLSRRAWKPRLHLTTEEYEIVKTEGTVCILGRSGTGKTVCIACRIQYDRDTAPFTDHSFRQLFVARSNRICTYVEETVGKELDENENPLESRTKYMKFSKLVESLEQALADNDLPAPRNYADAQHIGFGRFKREFFPNQNDCDLDALVIWAQIRTFIKGSVDSVLTGRPLSREEYLALGERECRINSDQRQIAYAAFEAYERFLDRNKYWDDCDQMRSLVCRLRGNPGVCHTLSYSKLYVDEIQDYTQLELALFFLLCPRGGLFLAGDPAQSVVLGVDFRFEHIRIVAHKLFDSMAERAKYIPAKPTHVTRNFRSHKGILDLAAAVLERLFAAFPGSTRELGADEGVFKGPRPGIFEGIKDETLKELTHRIDGGVLLTMYDSEVERLTKLIDNKNVLVLSIRDSKGLEWSNVILVDFFASLDRTHQIPWRKLIQSRTTGNADDSLHMLSPGFPEMESQLKQLYTAITRCSRRLFVAETQTSAAGRAWVRFWTSAENPLAHAYQNVDTVERMVLTADEWCTTGITYASEVESSSSSNGNDRDDDLDRMRFWLDKAFHCFEQAENETLMAKAQVHLESVQFRQDCRQQQQQSSTAAAARMAFATPQRLLIRLIEEELLNEAAKVCRLLISLIMNDATDNTDDNDNDNNGNAVLRDMVQERVLNRIPTSS